MKRPQFNFRNTRDIRTPEAKAAWERMEANLQLRIPLAERMNENKDLIIPNVINLPRRG